MASTPVPLAVVGDLVEVLAPLLTLAIGVAYARRCATLAHRSRPVAGWRQLCFAGGLVILIAADVPPLSTVAGELVVAHMAQHLMIGDLAALLIVLGLTGPVMQPVLAVRGLGWLRVLGNPLVAFPLWVANLYLWHLAALYQGVLDHPALHFLQHAGFLGFGIAMWMPLVGPLPRPSWFGDAAMLIYIVAVRFAGAVLANVLIWSGSVLYPDYAAGEAKWSISPLADQGAAGNLMMIETGAVTLALFAWLFLRAASRSVEKQELLDLARERGVRLDEARAARAVAAGQGSRLRKRLLGNER
jgi:cytochrome c oxidase assembly factor CtaG